MKNTETEFAGTKATLQRLFILVTIVFFSITLTPEVIIFCRVSACKCSQHWALTLTLCRELSRQEVLHHHKTPCSVCTICPLWSHSCSRPSAGIPTINLNISTDFILAYLSFPKHSESVLCLVYSVLFINRDQVV